MFFTGLDLHNACKVNRHHRSDVGHTETVGGDEVAVSQALVEHDKELLQPCQATLRQFGNLRIVHLPGQRPVGHGRRAVAQCFGDGHQPLELDAPVPARNLRFFVRGDTEQRRRWVTGLQVGRDRRVVGQYCPIFSAQRWDCALRIDFLVGPAQLLGIPQVHLDRFMGNPLFGEQNAGAARAGCGGAVVEGDHDGLSIGGQDRKVSR